MKAIINITLKQGILDPAGKASEHALNSLGFTNISDVHIAKQIRLKIDETDKQKAKIQLQKMCDELLANPVIEDYEILL